MSVGQMIRAIRDGVNLVGDHAVVFGLVQQDRDAACQAISNLIAGQPQAVVDRFEQILLQQSVVTIDPDCRRRMVELYAWLKVEETAHNGRFCGFLTAE